jgi:hypothetical protein
MDVSLFDFFVFLAFLPSFSSASDLIQATFRLIQFRIQIHCSRILGLLTEVRPGEHSKLNRLLWFYHHL